MVFVEHAVMVGQRIYDIEVSYIALEDKKWTYGFEISEDQGETYWDIPDGVAMGHAGEWEAFRAGVAYVLDTLEARR